MTLSDELRAKLNYLTDITDGNFSTLRRWAAGQYHARQRFGYVYFIADPATGAIKIGWALCPRKRLSSLQIGNQVQLQLLAAVAGTMYQEGMVHRHFIDYKIRGEWYARNEELDKLVSTIASIRGIPELRKKWEPPKYEKLRGFWREPEDR